MTERVLARLASAQCSAGRASDPTPGCSPIQRVAQECDDHTREVCVPRHPTRTEGCLARYPGAETTRPQERGHRNRTNWHMWQQLESGRVVHRFEWVVLVATLALIPVLVIESDVKSSGWQDF